MNMFDLTGKNAFVIGAGGIGSAIAKGLAEQGARVLVSDVSEKNAKAVVEAIKVIGGTASYLVADINSKAAVETLFAKVKTEFDTLDILVNSAGIGAFSSAVDMTEEIWNSVINHFLSSVFWCCREAGKIMIPQRHGKIVNLCSMSGVVVTGDSGSSYAAAKAGLIQLTKALATEWIPYGVYVNGISPGMVRTALTAGMFDNNPQAVTEMNALIPLGRIAQPIDMVGPAIFLASAASDYVIGQNLLVDGGYTAR
ncbi:MAG: SDR family oxidoreductase [Clostridia bacterium]